ncbi:MAG: preprotein translocase subunit SecE [Erysipelotrichaceae bacterium]|nr:preprotein translocase subunit SecE [Erysipelotrichaceae bacterium]
MDKELKEATYSPKAVLAELKKVQWPSFKELMGNSALVIVFTLLFGLYFFVCEVAASGLVSWIVSL